MGVRYLLLNEKNRYYLPGFIVMSCILVAITTGIIGIKHHPNILDINQKKCYFSQVLHLYCPGCGGTRAIKSLIAGDLLNSALSNVIPLYFIMLTLRIWIALLHNVITHKTKAKMWKFLHEWEAWGILIVVIGQFIIRNLLLVTLGIDYLNDLKQFW